MNKPQQEFRFPKDRQSAEKQTNVIDKINCKDYLWGYIGETG